MEKPLKDRLNLNVTPVLFFSPTRSLWEIMVAPKDRLHRRTYNVTAMSFSPEEIVEAVRKHFPDLRVSYKPDSRQNIGEWLGVQATRLGGR